jgi:hypothetical protein
VEPYLPRDPITVRELIAKLQKMDPEYKALFSWIVQVTDKTYIGFTAHDTIRTVKVIEDKPGHYVESNSTEATDVVVIE